MSIFNSVFDSLGAPFRSSFEDHNAPDEQELPLFHSPASSPRIPPPVTSTVLWSKPNVSLTLPPRVPDELAAIQRRARWLEEQLHELVDAQSESHMARSSGSGPGNDRDPGSASVYTEPENSMFSTPGRRRGMGESLSHQSVRRTKPRSLRTVRRNITECMRQLASVKAEETDFLTNGNLELQNAISQVSNWTKERTRLEDKIRDTESHLHNLDDHTRTLYSQASELEDEIRRREEELAKLKAQLRRIRNELSSSESAVEAEVASYKEDLRMLDKDVAEYLRLLPLFKCVPFTSKYLQELPPKRRTLHIAQQYWEDEMAHLASRCNETNRHHAALEEGVEVWNEIVEKLTAFENHLQDAIKKGTHPTMILTELEDTLGFLDHKFDYVASRGWKLLITAIGNETEALRQGKAVVEQMIRENGGNGKGKEKVASPVNAEGLSSPSLRSTRSPPEPTTRKTPTFHDTEDPDPELLLAHQDTDTD